MVGSQGEERVCRSHGAEGRTCKSCAFVEELQKTGEGEGRNVEDLRFLDFTLEARGNQ